jgi:PKD repeat protein
MGKIVSIFLILFLLVLLTGCKKNTAPECEITSPENNAVIERGTNVNISASAYDENGNLQEVRFYINNAQVGSSSSFPYSYSWNTDNVSEGSHIIKATALDEEGLEASDNISIEIVLMPEAGFIANPTSVEAGTSISFTDQSTGYPTAWSWDFGDGATSNEQNPIHTYTSVGRYTVSLEVSNISGSDTETKTDYITVSREFDLNYYGISPYTLQVGSTCYFSTYSNVGANTSQNVPDPGCAMYNGHDVWFSVVVPQNGIITVETQAGSITDTGLAIYKNELGALMLIECNDDDGNSLLSKITLTNQSPNETLYVRVWEYGGDVQGTFGICAYNGY